MAPKNIKLFYFDGRGRAEVSRYILALAGQPYEDIRHTYETWGAVKPHMPFGQVPVLEVDGKKYDQSIAIATYLAGEFGYYGESNLDRLKIDQTVQLGVDFLRVGFTAFMENDEAKKAELLKNIKDVEGPKFLAFFEKILKESGTGYVVGNSETLGDIFLYDVLHNFTFRNALTLDGFPHLQELTKRFESIDKIKAHIAARKETPF